MCCSRISDHVWVMWSALSYGAILWKLRYLISQDSLSSCSLIMICCGKRTAQLIHSGFPFEVYNDVIICSDFQWRQTSYQVLVQWWPLHWTWGLGTQSCNRAICHRPERSPFPWNITTVKPQSFFIIVDQPPLYVHLEPHAPHCAEWWSPLFLTATFYPFIKGFKNKHWTHLYL